MSLKQIAQLRSALHACPEASGREIRTKAMLMEFLLANTSLELHDCGDGFYAAHREATVCRPAMALRADYDAVTQANGVISHLCGHDGHAAALCGAALMAEGKIFGRNLFFLFQPAEETGSGAEGCLELFQKESVQEIYGAHNLPGVPLGQVVTRPGTFACASRGVTLRFTGKPTHAAHPEQGISPAVAVGKLLCALPALSGPDRYTGITLCTVIGTRMGEKAFGSAASGAEVWLTLRAEHNQELESLYMEIVELGRKLAEADRLGYEVAVQDVFPATVNHAECVQKVLNVCGGQLLNGPVRWSEDFGHYLKTCPGAFFGIGTGENHPALHTQTYEYPDELLQPTIRAFLALMQA